MENIQINGQRRWGPPKNWTGPPPPHGTEIFIKNLSTEILEEEIFNVFSRVGIIYEVRLPVHWTGQNRGYAFVRYTQVEEAEKALVVFDRLQLRPGKPIRVEQSVDNTRLFLSAVQKEKTARDIEKDLADLVENVEKIYVYPTVEDKNVFRGYAFVEFQTHRDAAIAKRILTPDVCSSVFERNCIAAWANPLPFVDGAVRRTIIDLFLRNIPKEMKNFQLKQHIKELMGSEDACRIKRNKNFAFLTFKNHDQAKAAFQKLKSESSFTHEYEIEVQWAVPKELAQRAASNKKRPSSASRRSKSESDSSCDAVEVGFTTPGPSWENLNSEATANSIPAPYRALTDLVPLSFATGGPVTFLRQTDYESDLYGDATDYRVGESRTHRTDFRSPGPSWENFISEEATNFLRSVPRNVPSYVSPRVDGFGPNAYRRLQYRPIRGSKFSPSVSCCDSDREQTPSPPSAAVSPNPRDHRMLGSDFHFPEGINYFNLGTKGPFHGFPL